MEFASERERREEALRLIGEEGLDVVEAARRVGRSRQWLSKWKRRAAAGEGVKDRSRAPLRSPGALPEAVVARVLDERDRLEADPVASVGGVAILAALEQASFRPLPSLRSIERILARHGRSKPRHKKRSRSTVPVLPLPDVGPVPGVWQQTDWVQDRYLTGGIRFNSIQLIDVGSTGAASHQYEQRTVLNAVRFLIKGAWSTLSIPQALSVDNAFTKTSHRDNPWTMFVKACLFFGVEVVVSPPHELGWTNSVENLNNLWQARTITRHHYTTLEQLRISSNQFTHWANYHRPVLNPATHATRYPAVVLSRHRSTMRWPPDIAIDDHFDHAGNLHIPLTAGRVTFLRRVQNRHVTIAHHQWPIDLPDHALVVATITTKDATLTLRHQATAIATYPYPIHHPVTDPYYHPPTPHSLYQHA